MVKYTNSAPIERSHQPKRIQYEEVYRIHVVRCVAIAGRCRGVALLVLVLLILLVQTRYRRKGELYIKPVLID